ncbi:hypothetical protein X907_1722 [Glycocaulis alkaliphilus]|uniref:Uncharacterized protein n=1 Tax=Glycocaulis alkaliphilus TaxID=1434191 RepID=A0A3T0E9Z4_9PROT|nr:hypothetical protein [Glycocaulis alkaliphilus]AZU04253.1 hypothetical protein X907_1722 [Glycocaulis alkaliphilus]
MARRERLAGGKPLRHNFRTGAAPGGVAVYPSSFDELAGLWRGAISIAVCFALAFLLPDSIAAFAGVLFALMGLIAWLCSARAEARIRQQGAAAP